MTVEGSGLHGGFFLQDMIFVVDYPFMGLRWIWPGISSFFALLESYLVAMWKGDPGVR